METHMSIAINIGHTRPRHFTTSKINQVINAESKADATKLSKTDKFKDFFRKIGNFFTGIDTTEKTKLGKLYDELQSTVINDPRTNESKVNTPLNKFEKFIMIASLADEGSQNQFKIKRVENNNIKFQVGNTDISSIALSNNSSAIVNKYIDKPEELDNGCTINKSLLQLTHKILQEDENKNLVKLHASINKEWDLSNSVTKNDVARDMDRIDAYDENSKQIIQTNHNKFKTDFQNMTNQELLGMFAGFQGIFTHQAYAQSEAVIQENGNSVTVRVLPGNGENISTTFKDREHNINNEEVVYRHQNIMELNENTMTISTTYDKTQIKNSDLNNELELDTGLIFEDKFEIIRNKDDGSKIMINLIESKMKLKL
jgi:hypothetical protein